MFTHALVPQPGRGTRLRSATVSVRLAPGAFDVGFAEVVQRKNVCAPCRERGFDSRLSLYVESVRFERGAVA